MPWGEGGEGQRQQCPRQDGPGPGPAAGLWGARSGHASGGACCPPPLNPAPARATALQSPFLLPVSPCAQVWWLQSVSPSLRAKAEWVGVGGGVGRAVPGKPVGPVWQSRLGVRVSQRPRAGETLGWKPWGAPSRQEAQGTQEHRPASPQTKAGGAPRGSVSLAGQPHPQPGRPRAPAPQVGGTSCCPSQSTGRSLSRPRICLQPPGSRSEGFPGRQRVHPPRGQGRAGRWQLGRLLCAGVGGGAGARPPAGPVGLSVASEGLGLVDGQPQGPGMQRPALWAGV